MWFMPALLASVPLSLLALGCSDDETPSDTVWVALAPQLELDWLADLRPEFRGTECCVSLRARS